MKKTAILTFAILFVGVISIINRAYAQDEKKFKVVCGGFYNVENLFDTINDPETEDEEFTPEGSYKWNGTRYLDKIERMGGVIAQIGTELTPDGPAFMGLCEVENRSVIEDLTKSKALKKFNYQIVHYDCWYYRGVDVGFIYQPKYFKVLNSKTYRLYEVNGDSIKTRDQLLVSGILDGDTLHVIVNHWPSRRGGEKRSRPFREAAADLCRGIVDSLLTINAEAKIIVMGDLNDDPNNTSVKKHLLAVGSVSDMNDKTMYNPMEKLYKDGIGSLAYQDNWNLFDQIILSRGLISEGMETYKFHKAKIFNKKFLMQQEGRFKGYPFRTYVGTNYTGGYSDHFPSYIFLIKEVK